ncbi:MAG: phenylalanine--tRNA ligase subunit alpha, partial [Candidatus Peribacteraceae bacterium]|nr:phenylalanine--tRNA ligase subunit alpha [Candidatus Peribacteraceae bacterium]
MNNTSLDSAKILEAILNANSKNELDDIEQSLFGRKSGSVTLAMKDLQKLDEDARKETAKKLNADKQKFLSELEKKHIEIKTAKKEQMSGTENIDISLSLPSEETGHLHPISQFITNVEEVFGRMGFDVAVGPEIENEELNFDLLNFPKEHAARDSQDVFFIKSNAPEDNKLLLRAHTSPVQIRYMREHKPPFRAIFPGKVYRKDADATHSPMFHQFEGLMIGEDVSLANMKAVMITAIKELISKDAEFRFRTAHFPFVEPGLEVDMRWQGDDDSSREGKWMEVVGCGMVHPNVLENCNIDSKKYQGFAFGFGIERMIMIRDQIPDLRAFFVNDLRFLRQ